MRSERQFRVATLALAALAALAVYAVSHLVFPHHSTNHDEAVYLQQAALLLEGQLALHPPVTDAFRPWFFFERPDGLYPKYTPVPAAVFAVGMALGDPRLSLAVVAGCVVGLSVLVATEAFDRRTGLLAGVLVLASPLVLVDAATFLPYAPTLALELGFLVAYLRATRLGDRRWAAVAGAAIGLAFFARPYTALLFALPTLCHAAWTLRDRGAWLRQATTAALGLCGVGLTLAYNAVATGDPLLFPYEAFAPRDGLGFGRRAILGHERVYTPALALRANAEVVARLFSRWVVAGALGTLLAALGVGLFLSRVRERVREGSPALGQQLLGQGLLAGLFLTVVAGNVLFWGNLNVLGVLTDPADGLVRYLGPYYHLDLVVPTSAFAASGLWWLADRSRAAVAARDTAPARQVGLAALAVSALVLTGAGGAAIAVPLAENRANTDQLAVAYEPVERTDPDGALVFLPTPYGDWLTHPFQALRNDPGYDGETVYALRERQFAVVDAFPDRRYYRYSYRGAWAPFAGEPIEPRLQRVAVARGERVAVETELGVPEAAEHVSIRLSAGGESAYYAADGTPDRLNATLVVANGTARLTGDRIESAGDRRAVPVGEREDVTVTAFVGYPSGGFDYRIVTPVERQGRTVRALTPYAEVCYDARRCGGEAAHVPETALPGVSVRTAFVNDTRKATERGGEAG